MSLHRRQSRSAALALSIAVAFVGGALWQAGASRAAQRPPATLGPEGVPIPVARALAGPGRLTPGAKIDGIPCAGAEQLVFHIHAHLTIFVGGAPLQVPGGVGIGPPREAQSTPWGAFVAGGSCFSWLHTHAADGIIHIESPVQRTFTLGEFFDVWKQPLGPHRAGSATGLVTAFLDGKRYRGNPRGIPLRGHAQIQVDVGRPVVAPVAIRFPPGL